MPRSVILHQGYLSPGKRIDTSLLPKPGVYKVIAIEKTPRNSQGSSIHVSPEIRQELNRIVKQVKKVSGNQLTHDDVIAHLITATEQTGVALWHF